MSVNLEIQVGLWIPQSVPYTAMSASLRSRKVGSLAGPSCCSGTTTRTFPPSSSLIPHWGSSVISTSAISQLVVASQPGNPMPAALRTTLRPPSHPTR
jgi:hypothetical protein